MPSSVVVFGRGLPELQPSQLSLYLKKVPVGADLEALMTSPGQVWNSFSLRLHASGIALAKFFGFLFSCLV